MTGTARTATKSTKKTAPPLTEAQRQPLSDCAPGRPQLSRQRLVDDGDRILRIAVLRREQPAFEQAHAKHFEESRRDGASVRHRRVRRDW